MRVSRVRPQPAVLLLVACCALSCQEQPGTGHDAGDPPIDATYQDVVVPDVAEIPDTGVDAADVADAGPNPHVIELPPTGQNDITAFTNWGYYITYSEDRGDPVSYRDVYYYDVLAQAEYQVTDRVSSQTGPYVFGDEIIFQDHQFADLQAENYQVELYHYQINTGIETRLTDSVTIKTTPKFNQDYIIYHSNEGCAEAFRYNLSLMNRQTGEVTVVSECEQDGETHSIGEEYAAWTARPFPGHNKDIFYRDLSAGVTFHIDSTGPGSQYFPHAEGDQVVWEDEREGHREIYLYTISIGVEESLTPDPWEQAWPKLRNGIMSWCDYSFSQEWGHDGRCDIYVYELATGVGRRVTSTSELWRPRFVDSGWIFYVKRIVGSKYKLYAHDLVGDGILTPDGHVIP
ncbi:hypothetical protein ACFL51_01880 [Myxococcota bacterium]